MFEFTYGTVTEIGDIRKENQDSIFCVSGKIGEEPAALFVVADGMGGLSYGAQVSHHITDQFARWWRDDLASMILAGRNSREDIEELMEQEIWDINQAVFHFKEQEQCRAGSTLSLLLFYQGRYLVKNIGDSRIYLIRNREFLQLTQDQSLVAQMVREHRMTLEEARYSSRKNILTMCIGMFEVPRCFSTDGWIQEKDYFLLCSDGLYNQLLESQIIEVIEREDYPVEEKALYLRKLIPQGMASDNVSAIVVEVK